MIQQNTRFMKTHLIILTLIILMASGLLLSGCEEALPDPPVIKSYINGTETDLITVEIGTVINYKYEIQASDKISDLKLIIFDVLSFEEPMIKTGVQTLVGGLTRSLNEIVEGSYLIRQDTELMLLVKDNSGNEANKSIMIRTE